MAPVARDLAAGVLPLAGVGGLIGWAVDLPSAYFLQVGALYVALVGLVLRRPPTWPAGSGIGAANRVTLLRATIVIAVAGVVPYGSHVGYPGAWWVVAAGGLALVLDGVDGRVARRTGTESRFGARFDMELDAFLLLALSLLVWLTGQTGSWVVLIGTLRYLFVGVGWVWPPLRAELPPSRRRQTICAVQGFALLLSLAPVVSPSLASALAGTALVLLVYSFGADLHWLVRRASVRSATG